MKTFLPANLSSDERSEITHFLAAHPKLTEAAVARLDQIQYDIGRVVIQREDYDATTTVKEGRLEARCITYWLDVIQDLARGETPPGPADPVEQPRIASG